MSAAGFVLVGGKSRRMGRDKALLPWNSGVLAHEIAIRVSAAAGSATLVGDPALYGSLGFPCIPDVRPGLGPLAGLETALTATLALRNLVIACDMPDLPLHHLRTLLDTSGDCIVTEDATGQLHPLCAVYHARCLPAVRESLDRHDLKLLDLVLQLKPVYVRYPGALPNINTLEDLASAR
jgi:molybdopterin-guanine dinucleotide biosynthesis protein A